MDQICPKIEFGQSHKRTIEDITQLNSTKSRLRKLVEGSNYEKDKKLDPYIVKLLSPIFTGMQGRYTRLKIVLALAENPLNTRQLSQELDYDFKSIQHNLKILEENHLLERAGAGYGDMFFLSELLEDNLPTLLFIIDKVDKRLNKKKNYI